MSPRGYTQCCDSCTQCMPVCTQLLCKAVHPQASVTDTAFHTVYIDFCSCARMCNFLNSQHIQNRPLYLPQQQQCPYSTITELSATNKIYTLIKYLLPNVRFLLNTVVGIYSYCYQIIDVIFQLRTTEITSVYLTLIHTVSTKQ